MTKEPRQKKPPKPKGPSHAELLSSIRSMLRIVGYDHYKNFGGPIGEKGLPDITAMEPKTGRYVGIEVKAEGDSLRPDQIKWRNRILRAGGIFIEARSLDDVIDGLGIRDRFLI